MIPSDRIKAIFLFFQTFAIAHLGDRHLSYLAQYSIEVPSMITLYLLSQTTVTARFTRA
jgi:hypothetical protein